MSRPAREPVAEPAAWTARLAIGPAVPSAAYYRLLALGPAETGWLSTPSELSGAVSEPL